MNSMRSIFDRIKDAHLRQSATSSLLTESIGVVTSEDNRFSVISEEEIRNRFNLLKEGKSVVLEYLDEDYHVCEGDFVYQHGTLFQIVEGVPIRKDAVRVVFNSSLSRPESVKEVPQEKESFEERHRRIGSLVEYLHRRDIQICERSAFREFDHRPVADIPKNGSPSITFWSLNEDRQSLGKKKIFYRDNQVVLVNESDESVAKRWDLAIFNRMTDEMSACRNLLRDLRQVGITEVEFKEHKFARLSREAMEKTLANLKEGQIRDFDIEVLDHQGRIGKTNISITEQGVRASYGRNPQNVVDTIPAPVYLRTVTLAVKPIIEDKNKPYATLNDAATVLGIEGLGRGETQIWYTNDDLPEARFFRIGSEAFESHDMRVPTLESLEQTHIKLGQIEEANLDQIYYLLQAPIWSPEGEARDFIMSLGSVFHTSMSVGDIIVIDDTLYMVDSYGFSKIEGGKFDPFVVESPEEGEEETTEAEEEL
jgi:hypothetical protein